MAAGGGDLERALGALLALDVLEVDQRAVDFADLRLRTGEHLRAAEMIGELNEGRGGDDLHFRARPRGFGPAGGGADQTFAARVVADRRRQHARDRRDRAVKPELPRHREPGARVLQLLAQATEMLWLHYTWGLYPWGYPW